MPKETFSAPFPVEDENRTIWPYMDFTKFISLLDRRRLFLCRADKLEDPFEGSLPLSNVENLRSEIYKEKAIKGKWGIEKTKQYINDLSEGSKLLKRFAYISSWFMNEHESAAMWKLYTRTNEAVAIKSTVKRLRDSLPKYDELLIGRTRYMDYKVGSIEQESLVDRFFYKRKSFDYEEELRVVVFNLNEWWDKKFQVIEVEGGAYIKTKIDVLINKIYVAPNSPEWFQELVNKVARLYGINKKTIRTSLDDKALY